MEKPVYELSEEDLRQHPVWYFPMDDSVDDETIVRPAAGRWLIERDLRLVVRSAFTGSDEVPRLGYIYWSKPPRVDQVQPVLLLGAETVTFWNGMSRPAAGYIEKVRTLLSPGCFPLTYASEECAGLESLRGTLEGLYFVNDRDEVELVRIG